jgi:hypothetical protein
MQMLRLMSSVILLLAIITSTVHAQGDRGRDQDRERFRGRAPEWILLGTRHVDFTTDRDRIDVSYSNRLIRYLHIFVDDHPIHIMRIAVTFMDGTSLETKLGGDAGVPLPAPGRLPTALEVARNGNYIKEIELVYKSDPQNASRKGVVRVVGELMPTDSSHLEWVELGCEPVNILGRDRDTIRVGLREGRFRAIRLHARDAGVYILDLKVVYVNGITDDIEVRRRHLRAGTHSDAFDLIGRERAIRRVDIVYRSELTPVDLILGEQIRRPFVCLEGLQNLPF